MSHDPASDEPSRRALLAVVVAAVIDEASAWARLLAAVARESAEARNVV